MIRNINEVDMKIVLLGHEAVGKSSLMERFVANKFDGIHRNTIGTGFASKDIEVHGKTLSLGIWDTAGSERYEAMISGYYRGAAAALICYDVTNPITFTRAKFWMRELRTFEENCKVYICGTKKDLLDDGREANPRLEIIEKYADGVQLKFFLTSSKTGENVDEVFQKICEDFITCPINKKRREAITLEDGKITPLCCSIL